MSSSARKLQPVVGGFGRIHSAKAIVEQQAQALEQLAAGIPADFDAAIELLLNTQGSVIVTGMGKAGWIGQKISASLASTGTRSHFLHPAEAIHGDLGRIAADDIVLALSNSGETGEIVTLLPTLNKFDIPVIAITARAESTLGQHATLVLDYGKVPESGHLGLAPSTSTTVMLALGDALALTVSDAKTFQADDFAKFHPGGSLGRRLSMVEEIMRPIDKCRLAVETETIREVYIRHQGESRRTGAVMVVSTSGKLTGIFTDSDLARLLERQQDFQFDNPIAEVMTNNPHTIERGTRTELAIETLACRNISELPVICADQKPIGLIDITDVVNIA
jgi:arabinose-5-phosphate isomerase